MAAGARNQPAGPQGSTPHASPFSAETEAAATRLGAQLIEDARAHGTSMLSAAFWSDKLMDWAMQDEAFKVQLFRFIDCFPAPVSYKHLTLPTTPYV